MKYLKGDSPFDLEDGKKSMIRVFTQNVGEGAADVQQPTVLMVPVTYSDKMVLTSDIKCLLPDRSRGAILPRVHEINLTSVKDEGVITLHPEIYDDYIEKGFIDESGEAIVTEKVQGAVPKKPIANSPEAPKVDKIIEPTQDPNPIKDGKIIKPIIDEGESEGRDPLDVNGDGTINAKDVAEVAEKAAENMDNALPESEFPEKAGDLADNQETDKPNENQGSGEPT